MKTSMSFYSIFGLQRTCLKPKYLKKIWVLENFLLHFFASMYSKAKRSKYAILGKFLRPNYLQILWLMHSPCGG